MQTLQSCTTGNSKTALPPPSRSPRLLSPVNLVPLLHDHVFSNLAIVFLDLSSAEPFASYSLIVAREGGSSYPPSTPSQIKVRPAGHASS